MKLCFFVLLMVGPFVVAGQSRLLRSGDADTSLLRLLAMTQQKVRVMPPDQMACLMPDMTRVEHMPVSRGHNADKMPNPLARLSGRRKGEK